MPRIDDGHPTKIIFSGAPGIAFYQKTTQPPGVDGGGPNDTTTFDNTTWRTMAPKKLRTMTPATITAAYDPAVITTIVAQCNVNQLLTVEYADGSSVDFWGWLDKFIPGTHQEGAQPTAEVTIQPSNQNDSGVETAPVYNAP